MEAEAAGSHPEVGSLVVKEERPTALTSRLDWALLARCWPVVSGICWTGRPVEFAVSYLPLDYAWSEELGHHLDHFEEEIRVRMPTSQEGKTLRLSAGNGRDSGSAPALTVGWSERPDGTLVYTLVRRR